MASGDHREDSLLRFQPNCVIAVARKNKVLRSCRAIISWLLLFSFLREEKLD